MNVVAPPSGKILNGLDFTRTFVVVSWSGSGDCEPESWSEEITKHTFLNLCIVKGIENVGVFDFD
jgi:hypothetical protein